MPVSVAGVWRHLFEFLDSEGALPKRFFLQQITGHPENLKSEKDLDVSADEIESIISNRGLTGFHVDTGHSDQSLGFDLVYHSDIYVATFTCRVESKSNVPNDWTGLLERLLHEWSGIGAWQYQSLYQVWQGASNFDEFYESRFGPLPAELKTYLDPNWNGIFERRILIDIFNNPGRNRPLLQDLRFCPVNFYPTAEMWLGPDFWPYAKCAKEEALAADFWLETREEQNYTYFKCWPHPFTRPDGEQGRMQQRLWKLFFHEDCEWPPGSGTICDEPMFGPPELMPDHPEYPFPS